MPLFQFPNSNPNSYVILVWLIDWLYISIIKLSLEREKSDHFDKLDLLLFFSAKHTKDRLQRNISSLHSISTNLLTAHNSPFIPFLCVLRSPNREEKSSDRKRWEKSVNIHVVMCIVVFLHGKKDNS